MTCFKTYLRLKENVTLNMIWDAVKEWRCKSQNSSEKLVEELKERPLTEKISIKTQKENFECIYLEDKKCFGVRLTEYQGKKCITTSIVANASEGRPQISYIMEMDSDENISFSAPKLFEFLRPHFEEDDYPNRAFSATQFKPSEIADFICGKKAATLPIVYISRKNRHCTVDPDTIAEKLYCFAWVIYEDDDKIAENLRSLTDGMTPYNGAAGIFWKRRSRIFLESELATKPETKILFAAVSKFLATNRLPDNLTLDFVQKEYSAILKKRYENTMKDLQDASEKAESTDKKIETLENRIKKQEDRIDELVNEKKDAEKAKKHAEDELRNFTDEFDKENKELQNKNERLQNQLSAYETSWEDKKKDTGGGYHIFVRCNEKELFPDEIKNYLKGVIYSVSEKDKDRPDDKGADRRKDVASAICEKNPDFNFKSSTSSKKFDRIRKQIGQREKGKTTIEGFGEIGTGGHQTLSFCGDNRYTVTFPSTPSDKREPKNIISDAKRCFLEI